MTTRLTRWLTTLDNFEAKMAQSKPFFHAENGGFSTILAVFQRFSALHLHPFRFSSVSASWH